MTGRSSMPGKSQRGRSNKNKKKKGQRVSPVAAQQPPVAQVAKPVAQPGTQSPASAAAAVPKPSAKTVAASYPYVAGELRRIGMLAGIMLVALVVMALILT